MGVADPWAEAKSLMGSDAVTLGPHASFEWRHQPEHLAMVLARYRAAAALVGDAPNVLEVGCGEGIGAAILGRGRQTYRGIDSDADAIGTARRSWAPPRFASLPDIFDFEVHDAVGYVEIPPYPWIYRGVVLLDVIEHIPLADEDTLMLNISRVMADEGVCVVGTPNKAAEHLQSDVARAGHVNLYTHARLLALMQRYFHRVQSFGMQDTSLHFGHTAMRHYLLMVGFGPKEMRPKQGVGA